MLSEFMNSDHIKDYILLPMTKFKIWFLALAVLGNIGVHLYFESISTISLTMQLYLYHKIIVEHA